MSEPEVKKEAPAPVAPAFGELFELSFAGLVNAPSAFFKLDQRPTAAPSASFFVAMSWGAIFFALNLVHVIIAKPGALAVYPAWQLGAVVACGFGAWIGVFFLGGSFLYGLGRTLGASGDFDRGLVAAALVLAAAPLQALCGWMPALWFLPTVLAAWIAACALTGLFKTEAWTARGLCALLAGGALGLQYAATLAVERYAGAALAAASAGPSPAELADIQKQLMQIQTIAEAPVTTGSTAAPGASSLDLLRGPGESAQARPPTEAEQRRLLADMTAQGDAMNKSVLAMLDSMAPMLNSPAITKNMSPQQKADFAELNKLISELKNGIATNATSTPEQRQKDMTRVQNLMMRMLSGVQMPPIPAAPAAPPEKKK
ncbi:MAG: hypothetical protein HY923_00120 [Elusimicrobia bacterium]|nr:hypothetical protein [Elusimicrobiota bacterium]